MKPYRRATLIQDISELRAALDPVLEPVSKRYLPYVVPELTLVWIIAEEIQRIYGISTQGHFASLVPLPQIHADLRSQLPIPLDVLISHYVKAPNLYGDAEIDKIEIRLHRDLYMHYKTNKPFHHG